MLCRKCKLGGDIRYTKEFIPFHKECVNDPSTLYDITKAFNSLDESMQVKILEIAYKPIAFTPNIAEAFHILEMLEEKESPGAKILEFINELVANDELPKSELAEKRRKELLELRLRQIKYLKEEPIQEEEENIWIL